MELYRMLQTKTDRFCIFAGLLSTVVFIMQTALLPIYSKVADITGRAGAYTIALMFYTLSFVIMAVAPTYEILLAGQVVYALGVSGTQVLGPILIGDMTSVNNRGFFTGLYGVPQVINMVLAPYVAQQLWDRGQWRLIYGMVPILIIVTSTPLLWGLWRVQQRVERRLVEEQERNGDGGDQEKEPIGARIRWLADEVDLVGSCLLIVGLCSVLLPLVLAVSRWGGWTSPLTLQTLFVGCGILALFLIWEQFYAAKPILPWKRIRSDNAIFGVLALGTVTIVSSVNWQYYTTYLQISRRVTAQYATYLERGYNVGYILIQVVVGYLMKRTGRWRVFITFGMCLLVAAILWMIPARASTSPDWWIVVSQTMAGIGSGMMTIPIGVAVQSSVHKNDIAIITAMMQVGGSISASLGSTIAGMVWNSLLPIELKNYVPGDYEYKKIVESIEYILALPADQYEGVVMAYGEIQKYVSILAVCFAGLAFVFSSRMRSFGLNGLSQCKLAGRAKRLNK
ncbi:major facilitator superfamily domain-containing protein [Dichotomocladium elegans]|nr:major facilitator superfamily domain-containing protein [Dichotomocladium elegans]